jgi:hypothetical protein
VTATTISFRADEQTMAELRQLAGDGNLSDAIRERIHAQYAARLYAQAARDAELWGPKTCVTWPDAPLTVGCSARAACRGVG